MSEPRPANIGPDEVELHPSQVAATRWLRLAIDRKGLLPKQVYLDLGRDKSTFSRWCSYEDEHCIPLSDLLAALPILGDQAAEDLIHLIRNHQQKKTP